MYKYSCRKCPIRSRCIEESNNAPGTKIMVRRAFDARTDTLSTWGILQKNCLLLAAEKSRSSSALSDRLQQVRSAKEQQDTDESQQVAKSKQPADSKKPVIRRLRPLNKPVVQGTGADTENPVRHPDYLQPVSPQKEKRPTKPLKRLSSTQRLRVTSGFYWLTISNPFTKKKKQLLKLPLKCGKNLLKFLQEYNLDFNEVRIIQISHMVDNIELYFWVRE